MVMKIWSSIGYKIPDRQHKASGSLVTCNNNSPPWKSLKSTHLGHHIVHSEYQPSAYQLPKT